MSINLYSYLIIIILTELILNTSFTYLAPKAIRGANIDYTSIFKGFVERIFLTTAIVSDLPHALTLFGALKLATRLKRENDNDQKKEASYNNFYLIGNFISVMIAIMYAHFYQKL